MAWRVYTHAPISPNLSVYAKIARAGKRTSECEKLEEGEVTNPGKYKTGMKAGYDKDGDGVPNGADKDPKDGSVKESKIQTPEQEQKLYESRFNKRNDEIFDKLKKLWTK